MGEYGNRLHARHVAALSLPPALQPIHQKKIQKYHEPVFILLMLIFFLFKFIYTKCNDHYYTYIAITLLKKLLNGKIIMLSVRFKIFKNEPITSAIKKFTHFQTEINVTFRNDLFRWKKIIQEKENSAYFLMVKLASDTIAKSQKMLSRDACCKTLVIPLIFIHTIHSLFTSYTINHHGLTVVLVIGRSNC